MATVVLTTSPATLDSGSSEFVTVTNTGAVDVTVSRGSQSFTLRPNQSRTVYPEGAAVTAVAAGTGQVTTVVQAAQVTQAQQVAANTTATAANTAAIAGLPNTYAGIPVPRLYYPRGLRRWRLALADARTVPAVVTAYGDSIVQGNNADNSAGGAASSVQGNYRTRGWPAQLRAALNAGIGTTDPGEGGVLIDTTNDPRLTPTTLTTSGTIAPHQKGWIFDSATDKLTVSVAAGSAEVRITQWNPSSAIVALGYAWDGGASPGTLVSTGSGDSFTTTAIATPDASAHTLTIWGPASGTAYLSRVDVFTVATASRTGVIVNRFGFPGQNTSAAFGSDFFTGTNQQRIMRSTFDSTGTNLAVFAFGANDYWYQPGGHTTSHNVTPTVFASNLQFGVDCVTNQNGKTVMTTPGCVLLVAGPRRAAWDLGSAPTYTEQAYYDAMKATAAANDHVAFLDLFESWGSQANAATAGLCATGDVHPYRAGHGDIARIIHGALTSREVTAA